MLPYDSNIKHFYEMSLTHLILIIFIVIIVTVFIIVLKVFLTFLVCIWVATVYATAKENSIWDVFSFT